MAAFALDSSLCASPYLSASSPAIALWSPSALSVFSNFIRTDSTSESCRLKLFKNYLKVCEASFMNEDERYSRFC
jgi:hypothetical protein